MSTLSTLVKQTKQHIEAIQKELVEVQHRIDALSREQEQLNATAQKSFSDAQAGNDPAQFQMALHFIDQQEKKVAELEATKQTHIASLDNLNAQIRQQFAEQKRYEILLERQEEETRQLLLKKQQAELDDLAGRRKA